MDAKPLLVEVGRLMHEVGLEAVLTTAHGLRSFEGVRARATVLTIDGVPIIVAALADIIKSKGAAGRPRDKAVIEILERAHAEATSAASRAQGPEGRE